MRVVVDSLTSLDIVIPDFKLWRANKKVEEKLFIDKKKNLLLNRSTNEDSILEENHLIFINNKYPYVGLSTNSRFL